MWFLQTDILIKILIASAAFAVVTYALRRLAPHVRTTPYLIILDMALIFYVSEKLAAFYVAYTLLTFLFQRVMLAARRWRKALFVALCLLCAAPFFYSRAAGLWDALPVFVTLIGFAYNMLKAIDGIFYVYYTGMKIPLLTYANFLLYFPVITAGPIFRYRDFEKGYNAPAPVTSETVERSVKRFILGMFKKMVLVAVIGLVFDRFAAASPHWYVSLGLVVLSYFTLYFDLSGYSDIAISISALTGIAAPENFKNPLSAATFTQFWRKWHVTLSDWIREHIFVVVNGKRLNKYISALIGMCTMIIMSLWHDFSIMSVIGGVYMGMFLVIENIFKLSTVNRRKASRPYFWFRCFLTNFFFAINTLFFTLPLDKMAEVMKGFIRL